VTARCSICSINFPIGYTRCQRCAGRLDHVDNACPDDDWQQRAAEDDPGEDSGDLRLRVHRMEQLQQLGLGLEASFQLATETDVVARARHLIGRGCPPDTAARILV